MGLPATGSGTRVAAVVLAAGCSSRMGSHKLLLPVGGRPMIAAVVDAALDSKASPVVVVVGHERERVRGALRGRDVRLVDNPDYAEGMSTSLQAGVRAVEGACDAVMIVLGDQPFVTAALLDRLIDDYAAGGARVVRPAVGRTPGHPVLMDAALLPDVLRLRGDVGAREIVARLGDDVRLVPVDDAAVLKDVDRPAEYELVKLQQRGTG